MIHIFLETNKKGRKRKHNYFTYQNSFWFSVLCALKFSVGNVSVEKREILCPGNYKHTSMMKHERSRFQNFTSFSVHADFYQLSVDF